jgi:tetratricopeptide (TPR) repeat protein
MGLVFRARDHTLRRDVALKRPLPRLNADPHVRRRFLREARIASQLSHLHIVPVFEVFEIDEVPWMVMELVDGASLRMLIRPARPLPLDVTLRHSEALASALKAAHAQGILHRDVNPKNVMVTRDGQALLMDFGLARVLMSDLPEDLSTDSYSSELAEAGKVVGTYGYMSPQQCLGRPVDRRSDLFSLGAVIYEMSTGLRPFSGPTRSDVLDATLHNDPEPIGRLNAAAPPELERIVTKALSKDREEGYQEAEHLFNDLQVLRRRVDHDQYAAEHPSAPRPKPGRRRGGVALAAAAALAIGVLGFLAVRSQPPPFSERDWLLIADLENTTDETIFDATWREALNAALSQSRFVNVFPRERLADALARMKIDPSRRLDRELGIEVCRREGLEALLVSSLRRSGSAFQISVQAIEPTTGGLLLAESETFVAKEELFERVDSLARRVREGLGESLGSIEAASRPLARATTASLEALELYSQARTLKSSGELDAASGMLRRAVELDPRFAMAQLELAEVYYRLGDHDRAVECFTRAYDLREEVSERERYLIAANYESLLENYEEAAQHLKVLVRLYPDDVEAHQALALAYDAVGNPRGAIVELREVLRLDPYAAQAYGQLGLFLAYVNESEEALEVLATAADRGLGSPYFGWGRGLALLERGNVDGALEAFRGLVEAGPPYRRLGQFFVARTAIYEGRLGQADEMLATSIGRDLRAEGESFEIRSRLLRARVARLRGQEQTTRAELERLLTYSDDALQAESLRDAGCLWAEIGEVDRARQVLARLRPLASGRPEPFRESCVRILEAEVALAEGRTSEAAAILADAALHRPRYQIDWGLGRVHAAQREWALAAGAFERVLEARGEILRDGFPAHWPLARLELARARKAQGELEDARAHYAAFLSVWNDADPLTVGGEAFREWQDLGDEGS